MKLFYKNSYRSCFKLLLLLGTKFSNYHISKKLKKKKKKEVVLQELLP